MIDSAAGVGDPAHVPIAASHNSVVNPPSWHFNYAAILGSSKPCSPRVNR